MNVATGQRASGGVRALIASLFFVSGACGLVYQVLWARMLMLVFGNTVHAVSTVLAAFMTGLAIGSICFGRVVDRHGHGLRLYGRLEILLGLYAVVLLGLLPFLDDLATTAYRSLGENSPLFALLRFVLTFLALVIPTTLMGGTLPALVRFATERVSAVGRRVGTLYAINTLGAAVGTVVVAFVLLESLGVRGTTYLTAGTNLAIGFVALALRVLRPGTDTAPSPTEATCEAQAPAPPAARERSAVAAVFWGFALSGFAALGYEVVWTRLLSTVLRITTTQSLSTMLVVFLAGLALGGAVGARFVDRWRRLPLVFGSIEITLGLFGLLSIVAFGLLPGLVEKLGPVFTFWGHMGKLLVAGAAVMLVPTFFMGLLFPIAGRVCVRAIDELGGRIGSVYAVNTGGAVLGAAVTGFVLVPLLGTQGSIQTLAAVNVAVGAIVILLAADVRLRTRVLVASAGVAAVAIGITSLPPTSLVDLYVRNPKSRLLHHDEGSAGTVTVVRFPNGHRLLRVNGAGEVPTDRASIRTFRLLGSLPMVLHEAPDDVLVIAFGGGVTLSTVERFGPRRLECVEVVPGVIQASRHFADHNNRIFERLDGERVRVIFNDGRNHVRRTDRLYDVIISDSTHPSTADSWVLYTADFYSLCKNRLSSGGMMAQWLPLHGLAPDQYKMILRTFASVFPHTTVWLTTDYSVLLGTSEPLEIDLDRLTARLGRPPVRQDLEKVGLGDPVSFVSTLALDESSVPSFVGTGPINTDDLPHVNFADRTRSDTREGLPTLLRLLPHLPERVPAALGEADSLTRSRLTRRFVARKHMLAGVVASRAGRRSLAVAELQRARQTDPSETEAERLLARLERAAGNSSVPPP